MERLSRNSRTLSKRPAFAVVFLFEAWCSRLVNDGHRAATAGTEPGRYPQSSMAAMDDC